LVLVKHFRAFPSRSMFYPPQPEVYNAVLSSGLVFAKGQYWSTVRGALQPLFHSSGLKGYHQSAAAAAAALAEEWGQAADAGEPVDAAAAMCNLALEVWGVWSGRLVCLLVRGWGDGGSDWGRVCFL
jgi:cytochrome P450